MAQPTPPQPPTSNGTANIISALGAAFKTQSGDPVSGERIAQLLLQNMPQLGELCKQGKLNQAQIMQARLVACFFVLCANVPSIVERIRGQT